MSSGIRFRLQTQLTHHNVVLSFLPKTYPRQTIRETEMFAAHVRDLEQYTAVLVGVTGAPQEELRELAQHASLPFPIAADPHLAVCRNYRVLWLGSNAIRRVTYVIDRRGIIRGVAHHELLVARHWEHVKRVLATIEEHTAISDYNRRANDL